MSKFYNPHRSRNLYDPEAEKPFKISRSKIDLYVGCPRCFYIDRRLGTGRPPGFPFNINSAVDTLLKAEFDVHRAAGTPHPLLEAYGLDAVPAPHAEIDAWRENFKGVQFFHEPTNLIITGAIDDLWIDKDGNYLVVDYKATAKKEPVKALDQAWQISYKRQMEIYQWTTESASRPGPATSFPLESPRLTNTILSEPFSVSLPRCDEHEAAKTALSYLWSGDLTR